MGILCPVILPATGVVTPRDTKFAQRRTVGSKLVGDDGGWSDALLLQKFSHELECRLTVAPWLNENIQNLAFTVHGTPDEAEVANAAADEDIIAELAALGPLAYAKRRKAASAEIGVGVGELDRIVAKARGEASAEAGPKTHQRWQIEPWEEPVATANLLDDLREKYAAHVILPEHGAEVMALWVLHAWSLDASYISPFLRLTSPEPRCGKSRALTLLYKTVPRTTLSSNISAAATAGSSTPATRDRCPAAADELVAVSKRC